MQNHSHTPPNTPKAALGLSNPGLMQVIPSTMECLDFVVDMVGYQISNILKVNKTKKPYQKLNILDYDADGDSSINLQINSPESHIPKFF